MGDASSIVKRLQHAWCALSRVTPPPRSLSPPRLLRHPHPCHCLLIANLRLLVVLALVARAKVCAACGDRPSVKNMRDSEAFALKHGLTVGGISSGNSRLALLEQEEVPTATCQVQKMRNDIK